MTSALLLTSALHTSLGQITQTRRRFQARELGDFVPIQSEPAPAAGSRLIREGDDSGDDEEDRIQVIGLDMPSDKPQREYSSGWF